MIHHVLRQNEFNQLLIDRGRTRWLGCSSIVWYTNGRSRVQPWSCR